MSDATSLSTARRSAAPGRGPLVAAAVVLACLLVAAGAGLAGPAVGGDAPGAAQGLPSLDVRAVAVAAVLAAVLAASCAALVAGERRGPRTPGRAPVPEAEAPAMPDVDGVAASFGASLSIVGDGDDVRAAIVAAYARLLDGLAEAGLARRPHEGPHEHLARALAELGVDGTSLRTLTDLYAEARFSRHRLGAEHRERAGEALRAGLEAVAGGSR